jgi:hypothetical protein
MNADISGHENAGRRPLRSWLLVVALGAGASVFAIYAIVAAPATRRTAERIMSEQIQQEDRSYCDKFRMPPGSEAFAACAADLTEIRRRQRDRSAAEAAGMF